MSLKISHYVFAAWMVSPLQAVSGSRPVDMLGNWTVLQSYTDAFAERYRPVETRK